MHQVSPTLDLMQPVPWTGKVCVCMHMIVLPEPHKQLKSEVEPLMWCEWDVACSSTEDINSRPVASLCNMPRHPPQFNMMH